QALLQRHSDGVRILLPGMPASFALESTKPSTTIRAGTTVLTAGAGRAEVSWDDSTASITLTGPGALRLGESDKGAPLATILYVDRARIMLGAGDSLKLVGGTLLIGDDEFPSGPFHIQSRALDSLELTNQAQRPVRLRVGPLEVELGGGSTVQIPNSKAASFSFEPDPMALPLDRLQAGSLELEVRGDLKWDEVGGRVQLEANGPCEIHAMGMVLHLDAGERAEIGSLGGASTDSEGER
ncbi:MAG: hypothetical protein ACI8PQ_000141, partial [Planctomycetota bacterium]